MPQTWYIGVILHTHDAVLGNTTISSSRAYIEADVKTELRKVAGYLSIPESECHYVIKEMEI